MERPNDYDAYAAARQKRLQKGVIFPHRFVEKPAMESLLPDLTDKHVLMLGCGTGEESKLLGDYGADKMVGVDRSEESIHLANESYPRHQFLVGDMHDLDFADGTFDYVYSSLTIHYSDDPLRVYQEMNRVLKPGGYLQFSIGHPVRWASERITLGGVSTRLLGYSEDEKEPRLYGSYNTFAQHRETFSSGEILEFWIGPPSMHFKLLKQAGFAIEKFLETQAVEECKQVAPDYYKRYSIFPQFTIFKGEKIHEARNRW